MNKLLPLLLICFFGSAFAQMNKDSSSIGAMANNGMLNVIPHNNSSTTTKVLPPPVKVLSLSQSYIDNVCVSGGDTNPPTYDWSRWSSVCGSRSCKALGYTFGFISESMGADPSRPWGSSNGGVQLNCN